MGSVLVLVMLGNGMISCNLDCHDRHGYLHPVQFEVHTITIRAFDADEQLLDESSLTDGLGFHNDIWQSSSGSDEEIENETQQTSFEASTDDGDVINMILCLGPDLEALSLNESVTNSQTNSICDRASEPDPEGSSFPHFEGYDWRPDHHTTTITRVSEGYEFTAQFAQSTLEDGIRVYADDFVEVSVVIDDNIEVGVPELKEFEVCD